MTVPGRHNIFPGDSSSHVTRVTGFNAALGELAATGLVLNAPGYDVGRSLLNHTVDCTVDGQGPDGHISVRLVFDQTGGKLVEHSVLPR